MPSPNMKRRRELMEEGCRAVLDHIAVSGKERRNDRPVVKKRPAASGKKRPVVALVQHLIEHRMKQQ